MTNENVMDAPRRWFQYERKIIRENCNLCPQSSYHPNNRGQNVQETCEDCVRTDYETCVNNPNRRRN